MNRDWKSVAQVTVVALKRIQYVYSGAGRSYEDLCEVKQLTEEALKSIGAWDASLHEVELRIKK